MKIDNLMPNPNMRVVHSKYRVRVRQFTSRIAVNYQDEYSNPCQALCPAVLYSVRGLYAFRDDCKNLLFIKFPGNYKFTFIPENKSQFDEVRFLMGAKTMGYRYKRVRS